MRRLHGLALATLIGLSVLLLYRLAGERAFLANIEAQTLDLRFRLRGPVDPGPEIVLVLIDDPTLTRLGQWPLSRSFFADAVRRLKGDGARVIAFNLLFANPAEPLPSSVRAAIRRTQAELDEQGASAAAAALGRLLSDIDPEQAVEDQDFEAALREAGNVLVPFAFVFDERLANVRGVPKFVDRSAFPHYRLGPGDVEGGPRSLPLRPAGLLAPLPGIAAVATWMGHVTLGFDPDGTPRHEYPVIGFGGEFFPSLPIEAYRAYAGIERTRLGAVIPGGIEIGDRWIPTDAGMRLGVNYYGPPGTFRTVPFHELLSGRLPAGLFRDKLVLIGGTALGVSDSFPSPFAHALPGVERYATIVANIAQDRFLHRNVRTGLVEVAAILLGGLAAFWIATRLPVPAAIVAALALAAAWSALTFVAFAWWNLWIHHVLPLLSMVLTFVCFLATRVVAEERRRRRAERQRANLGRYFSPNIVEQLATGDAPFGFDRVIDAAVLFVDMVGFTRLSERMPPAEAIALLREFHGCVERAVFAHSGTLDKFLGDGAMASFGPPVPSADDAANALACARRLTEEADALSRRLVAQGRPPVGVGIGLHYGPVLMGNVGGERRFEFTVVGDTVNVASRLEGLTRAAGAVILASDTLIAAARATPAGAPLSSDFELLPPQRLRGREELVRVWGWTAFDGELAIRERLTDAEPVSSGSREGKGP